MAENRDRGQQRRARHARVRRRISGTTERPRLAVFKSSKHTYAQIIDDTTGRTLASASSRSKGLRDEVAGLKPVDVAGKVGEAIAGSAKEAGVTKVVFDRGGFPYKGRVKALAESARSGGLDF